MAGTRLRTLCNAELDGKDGVKIMDPKILSFEGLGGVSNKLIAMDSSKWNKDYCGTSWRYQ